MTYWNTTLSNFPLYCQLSDYTVDGSPDENAGKNCGEECISMVTRYLTGVEIAADTIKDEVLGQNATGTSTEAQLRGYLQKRCSIATSNLTPTLPGTGAGSLLNLIWSYTCNGKPLLELRWWDHPNSGFLHWCVVIGCDPNYVYVADPWTGTMIAETYDTHRAMYQGVLAGIERTRDVAL